MDGELSCLASPAIAREMSLANRNRASVVQALSWAPSLFWDADLLDQQPSAQEMGEVADVLQKFTEAEITELQVIAIPADAQEVVQLHVPMGYSLPGNHFIPMREMQQTFRHQSKKRYH